MAATQTYANHARYYPPYHFFALPVLLGYAIMQTFTLARAPGVGQFVAAVVAWALAIGIYSSRVMALRAQDRVIRLEETLRMQHLLPSDLLTATAELTPRQIVALRFASDAELPDLVRRTLAGEFEKPSDIKKAVREWRPDFLRA